MLTIPIGLIITHFIADFIFQNDWMALNKSKNTKEGWAALGTHAFVYSLMFLAWCNFVSHNPLFKLAFISITFITHFITDAITSRITSRLWFIDLVQDGSDGDPWNMRANIQSHKRHWFFVMIGFDQLIHYVTLALTFKLLN